MDGTLSPTLPHWLKAFHQAFADCGQSHTDEIVIKRCFYRDPTEFSDEFGLDLEQFLASLRAALRIAFEERALFAGVQEVLALCRELNVTLGLVSSASRETIEQALIPLGVFDHFRVIVAGGEAEHYKPHPAPVLLALEKLCASKGNTIFIGDAPADIHAGRAAGVDTALFYPDENIRFHEHDELMSAKPHFVFDDYAILKRYIVAGFPAKQELPADSLLVG